MRAIFHPAVERIERKLDDNEQAQRRLQREQDGNEVKSVQLETLIGAGESVIECRDSMETFREAAADTQPAAATVKEIAP